MSGPGNTSGNRKQTIIPAFIELIFSDVRVNMVMMVTAVMMAMVVGMVKRLMVTMMVRMRWW